MNKVKRTIRKRDPFYLDFEQWKNEFEQIKLERLSTQLLSETTQVRERQKIKGVMP